MFLELSASTWIIAAAAAFIVGFSKTGISGLGILAVVLMTWAFPAKESTGFILPLLIGADICALSLLRHNANWTVLLRLFPFVIPGIVAGYFFLGRVTSNQLRPVIGAIVLAMLGVQFLLKRHSGQLSGRGHLALAALAGTTAGFTTMTANAAGPVMAVYLLFMRLDKKEFMGTAAWYFFCMNVFKVPFSANLGLITPASLKLNILLFPAVLVGSALGYFVLNRIPRKAFEWAIQILAAAGGLYLILF